MTNLKRVTFFETQCTYAMKTSAVSSFEYLSECVALNQFTSLERQKQVLPTKTER